MKTLVIRKADSVEYVNGFEMEGQRSWLYDS